MKIEISIKNPDVAEDAIQDAVKASLASYDGDPDEKKALHEIRVEKTREAVGKWMEWMEYIRIEIDTDADTATVIRP